MHERVAQVITRRYGDARRGRRPSLPCTSSAARFPRCHRLAHQGREHRFRALSVAEALDHCTAGWRCSSAWRDGARAPQPAAPREARAANHAGRRLDLAIRDYTLMRERARATGAADRECDALVGLANALFFARRPDEMAVRTHEALVAAAQADSPARLAAARLSVALLLQDTGDLQNAEALIGPLVEEARELGLQGVLMGALLQRGTLHYWRSSTLRRRPACARPSSSQPRWVTDSPPSGPCFSAVSPRQPGPHRGGTSKPRRGDRAGAA